MTEEMRAIPRLYLGTMTFAWSQTSSKVDAPTALAMIEKFVNFNTKYAVSDHYIDTARIYAGGKTEDMIGEVLPKVGDVPGRLMIGTKAHPSQKEGLSPGGIDGQFRASLEAMHVESVDEYYLHQPDTENSLEESLKKLTELKNAKVISTIGMSNYHASEVKRAFEFCKDKKLVSPTVYQGLYNPLNRVAEDELLPLLRENGCSFVAYNPLAAGLLTGKHTDLESVQKGRFKNNQNYLPRFYTKSNFDAVALIKDACEKEGITMVEATFRWLLCHSQLRLEDGVLLGASSLEQLDENLGACAAAREKGPLSNDMLDAFDKAWEITRKGAFPYWRSYSSDMPDRENLDQGASYEAKKK